MPLRLSRHARRSLGVALAALAAAYLVALGIASSAPVERALRDRLHAALRSRLGEVRLGPEVRVDALFRVWFGPLELPPPGGGAPLVRIGQAMARPSLSALLRGRAEPATVLLGDVRVRPGPGGRDLRALAESLRAPRAFGAPTPAAEGDGRELPKLKLRGVVVVLDRAGAPLELGPLDADLLVSRRSAGPRLDAEVSLRAGARAVLQAERGEAGWRATLRGDVAAPALAALRGRAVAVTGGALAVTVSGEASADLARGAAQVRGEVEGLVLAGERVAAEPVGPLRAELSGRLVWDRAAGRVRLEEGVATLLRAVTVAATGEVTAGPPAAFSLSVRATGVDGAELLAALPPAIAIPAHAPRPAGRLDARLELAGPLLAPDAWSVAASLDLSDLRAAARRAGRSPLAEPFVHRPPLDEGGHGPELRIGPPNPDFVPVDELPEHVVRAVTTAEDAGFFAHPGFDFEELRNAVVEGARRGRLVRGGSTITQQVAKNLFLAPERTFARKIREAAITVGLEATLPKRRILEIYLNVAEWGPGVWGIGPAARHWFGKDARALSPKEAALLAAVIPSPVRYHAALFGRGALPETWELRVRDLLHTMAEQGALSEQELFEALVEPVVLAPPPAATAAGAPEAPGPGAAPAPAVAPGR